jgi:hypothetical protein
VIGALLEPNATTFWRFVFIAFFSLSDWPGEGSDRVTMEI